MSTTHILKVRDDHEPIYFEPIEDQKYKLIGETPPSIWMSDGTLKLNDLRGRIEPWLTSLFQSEHLSVLIGNGLSTAIQIIAEGGSRFSGRSQNYEIYNAMGIPDISGFPYSDKIRKAVDRSVSMNERGEANIEDFIRIINDLLRGLEIIEDEDAGNLRHFFEKLLSNFANSILKIENKIAGADEKNKEIALQNLVTFLMSFASRTGTRDRLHIFTTNYDRVIEAGAELAGLHLLDRFVGNLSPIFRSSRLDVDMHYNPPGIRGEPRYLEGVAKFTKLHGSIDWVMSGKYVRRIGLPFGTEYIKPYLEVPGLDADGTNIMIYPNSSKDRETTEYPYVELFRDFAAALCRPNSTLVTYGYSFGDDHINRVVRDMLTIPSTHLVVISYDDTSRRIMKFYKEIGRPSQISLIIGRDLADLEMLTRYFLPKPSIDFVTFRMNEILKQRYDVPNPPESQESKNDGGVVEI